MIKPYLKRQLKIAKGGLMTVVKAKPYRAQSFWDDVFYTAGVSDHQTLNPTRDELSALYHYASVEMLILKYLVNHNTTIRGWAVLDIGSGAGHWLDFYRELGAGEIVAIDISKKSTDYLRSKYGQSVDIYQGSFQDILESRAETYDLINAIGVMFHVVDDDAWQRGLEAIAKALNPGGLFIATGYFGLIGNFNVQIDSEWRVNKRLRSLRRWNKILRSCGFRDIGVYRNRAYLDINATQPENNLLVAKKP